MTSASRNLLLTALLSAGIGFAAGWFARMKSEPPTLESRTRDAADALREKLHELTR